jgi:hypothetical protein
VLCSVQSPDLAVPAFASSGAWRVGLASAAIGEHHYRVSADRDLVERRRRAMEPPHLAAGEAAPAREGSHPALRGRFRPQERYDAAGVCHTEYPASARTLRPTVIRLARRSGMVVQ